MSGKRKTLSRYKKNKNDTTKKKRTKRSDSRFKRSSNKAITKQIGGTGTRGSISDNPGRIDEILNYLYNGEEGRGQYYADKLRRSFGSIGSMKFYDKKIYISYSDIGNNLTSILMPWYYEKYNIFLGTTDELKEIGLIVDALLSSMKIDTITIDGFPYVEKSLSNKLRSDPRSMSLQDAEAGVVDTARAGVGGTAGAVVSASTTDDDKASVLEGRPSVFSGESGQTPGLYHFGIVHFERSDGRYVSFSVPGRVPGHIPYEYILYLKENETIEQFVRGTYGLDWRLGDVKELFLVIPPIEKTDLTAEPESSPDSIDKFLRGEIIDENGIENISGVEKLVWGPGDKLRLIIDKIAGKNGFIIVIKDHVRESIDESYELETGSKSELPLDSELESEGVSGYLVLNEPESSPGGEAEWDSDISPDDIQQFTLLVSMCDLRTGEKTDPLKLYNIIKRNEPKISINDITEKMIIEHSKILGSEGDDAGSDPVEGNISGIIDKLKERTDNDEHGNLYRKLKIFHELLEKNPDLIDSLLETHVDYITGEGITELERVEYNTRITVLKFLKSYLDGPPTPNDELMREIFLDDYRYVFLMN